MFLSQEIVTFFSEVKNFEIGWFDLTKMLPAILLVTFYETLINNYSKYDDDFGQTSTQKVLFCFETLRSFY